MQKVIVTGGSGFIGCNLVEYLSKQKYEVVNLDINPPRNSELNNYWKRLDILDWVNLDKLISAEMPDYIIHLAARTDLRGKSLSDYEVNTNGTQNIVNVALKSKKLKKVLFASSRLVCDIKDIPLTMSDYSATTIYGRSKVISEQIINRDCQQAKFDWLIFRPTSIWGPWFEEPYRDFFEAVLKGRYIHPGNTKIRKSFGYVGNSVFILEKMLQTENSLRKRTIYLSDFSEIDVLHWANKIRACKGFTRIKKVPFILLKLVALAGSSLELMGFKRVPLTNFRLNNLMTDMLYDVEPLMEYADALPYSVEEGILITLHWLDKEKFDLV